MSNNYPSVFSRFVMSCCAVIAITLTGMSPVYAQTGISGTEATTFPVEGLSNVRVNAAGNRVGGFGDSACPFSDMDMTKLEAAFAAAKDRDPDSCPHAISPILGRNIYFRRCAGVYATVAAQVADAAHPVINENIACCHKRPGADRDQCRNQIKAQDAAAKAVAGFLSKVVGVPPLATGAWSPDDLKKITQKKKEQDDADKQCFEDSFNRIEEYWSQKRGVSCIRFVSRAVKTLIKDGMRGLRNSMLEQSGSWGASPMTTGTSPGATFTMPSLWGLGGTIATAANFAADAITLASEASDILSTLSDQCGNIIPALRDIQEWRKTVLGINLCQAAENLLERQLTQCIRVNLDVSSALRLPQFSVMLQCPVNINLNMRLTPRGFDCYGGASVGSPIVASTGRRSLLSGNGGLENLFDGSCFTSPTSRPESGVPEGGMGQGGIGDGTSTTPGVDCGPLDPNPVKQANIRGQQVLGQGRTTNGWAIGGSENVGGQQITRCDMYDAGRAIRSAFVFGDGTSCRTQEGGFLSGGYETNTACYAGYTPAIAPNIPDACMFEPGCLDARGNFDINRAGTSGCPTSVPQFDINRVYNTFVQGGIDGGGAGNLGRPCSDFADMDPDAWKASLCCDPQRQDCREKDPMTPYCACDEGDAFNRVKLDANNNPDSMGRCEQGGKETCCSPRLNGGRAGCDIMGMSDRICEAEKLDQCVSMDSTVVFVGPDGVPTQNFTASQVAQSRPSPYMYLFVRPDVTIPLTGQQCCTTEWCNVCPQHYVNAYGLSLKRTPLTTLPSSDNDNHSLIGKGWPYAIKEAPEPQEGDPINLDEDTEYVIGLQEMTRLWVEIRFLGNDVERSIYANRVPLLLSDAIKQPASMAACNNLSYLKAKAVPAEQFRGDMSSSYGLGFAFNKNAPHRKKRPEWITYAGIPEPLEYPLDYLNRLRRGVTDAEGTPLPPITLCNDVKICTAPEDGTVLTTPDSGTNPGGSPQTPGPTQGGLLGSIAPIQLPSLGLGTISVQPGFSTNPGPSTGVIGTQPIQPGGTKMVTPGLQQVAPTVPTAPGGVKMAPSIGSQPKTLTPGPATVPSATTVPSAGNVQGKGSTATGKYGLY